MNKHLAGGTGLKHFSDTDENEGTWELLNLTYKALERAREIELQKVGISPIQAAVLETVKTAEGPVTPAKLS